MNSIKNIPNAQHTFERTEKKYLLTARQASGLLDALHGRMLPDDYGRHTIYNIYYDTPDYRLIRASLDKPVYKEKLRLRSYGLPGEESRVFIELKKKLDGIVYKRREEMTLAQARAFLSGGELRDSQILREISSFIDFYKVVPAAAITYDRVAYYGAEDPNLRITFDTEVRWRTERLDLTCGGSGSPVLGRGEQLMEIKIPGAMPLFLSEILTSLRIFPTSFSKYGRAYQLGIYEEAMKNLMGGRRCA